MEKQESQTVGVRDDSGDSDKRGARSIKVGNKTISTVVQNAQSSVKQNL